MNADDGLESPKRTLAFSAVAVAVALATLDSSVVNVALPVLARDLHVDPATAVWAVNAFQLTVTVCLLPMARLGDAKGYKKIYLLGLATFTFASLLCAFSINFPMLVAARVLQALGGAAIISVNIALLRLIFPSHLLGSGIGKAALVVAISSAAGPAIAAAVLAVAPWPALFTMNALFGLLALALAVRTLPETTQSNVRFDWIGATLNALTFGLLIVGITRVSSTDGATSVLCLFGGAALAGVALVWHQSTVSVPLLPLDLLRLPAFSLSIAVSTSSFVAQAIAYVSLPFYFYNVLGRSVVETGFLMTPWPLAVAVAAPVSGQLADRYSPGILGGIGLAILAIGLVLIATLPGQPSSVDIIWRLCVCGVGFGIFQSPNVKALIVITPRERSGSAGGLQSAARLLGQSIGAALAAVVFTIAPNNQMAVTLWMAAAFCSLGCVMSCLRAMNGLRGHVQ